MTTRQQTPSIERLLKDRRDGGYKSVAAREIGVSRQMYDAWEGGLYVPGDEWAEKLADYLERSVEDIVWILYRSRLANIDGKHQFRLPGLPTYMPVPVAA